MEDEKARENISALTLRVLAMRDVVARLVAYEAARHENPDDLLRNFSEGTETRIADVAKKRAAPSPVAIEEGLRKEIDWILSAARLML